MDKIKSVFTATAYAIGGRNGHTETTDGAIKADLSLPLFCNGGQGRSWYLLSLVESAECD